MILEYIVKYAITGAIIFSLIIPVSIIMNYFFDKHEINHPTSFYMRVGIYILVTIISLAISSYVTQWISE